MVAAAAQKGLGMSRVTFIILPNGKRDRGCKRSHSRTALTHIFALTSPAPCLLASRLPPLAPCETAPTH